jgi:hydrogenase maturation protease
VPLLLDARARAHAAARRAPGRVRRARRRGAPLILVLAVGNALRADDGAGPAAVAGLEVPGVALEVEVAHQLLPEHAAHAARADGVVFVDARDGGPPGEVAVVEVGEGGRPPVSHHLSPAALLALARALHGAAPRAFAISIAAADLGFGERLSAPVEAALPRARAAIAACARALAGERSPPRR